MMGTLRRFSMMVVKGVTGATQVEKAYRSVETHGARWRAPNTAIYAELHACSSDSPGRGPLIRGPLRSAICLSRIISIYLDIARV